MVDTSRALVHVRHRRAAQARLARRTSAVGRSSSPVRRAAVAVAGERAAGPPALALAAAWGGPQELAWVVPLAGPFGALLLAAMAMMTIQ